MSEAAESSPASRTFGPIQLTPGVRPTHVMANLFIAFVAIAMLSGNPLLNGYLLTEHLHLPRSQQGTVTGDLSFWVEVVAVLLFYPFGVLSDRIGRRPVATFGLLVLSASFVMMPLSSNVTELLVSRLVFAVGMAATAGTMATLLNDYPVERSRGKLIALTSMANILGAALVAGLISRIPSMLGEDFDAITGGRIMYMTVAGLGLMAALVARLGLLPGTPIEKRQRESTGKLFSSGLRAAKNPRIALAYATAFAARGDLVVKASFLSLWAIQDGFKQGMNPGQAMARFGIMLIIMSVASFVSAPVFGWLIDRINRVTSTIIALFFGASGYLSMTLLTSPLDYAMVPFFLVIALGSSFVMKASLSLAGQEAPIAERGSIMGMSSVCGAIGIMVFSAIGGRIFDGIAPWAPFVLAGGYQAVLLVAAVVIRVVAPGRNITGASNAGT